MLTAELKNIKKEIHDAKNPVPGKIVFIDEGMLRRRGQEDYQAIEKIQIGQRGEVKRMFFDYYKQSKLNNSLITDRDERKERVRNLKASKLTLIDKLMKIVKK